MRYVLKLQIFMSIHNNKLWGEYQKNCENSFYFCKNATQHSDISKAVFYGSIVALDNGAISSIMIWKSPALNVWISDMVYFVPLSRASVRMRVAATRLARSMQFLTVRALEK